MRYFDAKNNRLIHIRESATPDYWERQWSRDPLVRDQIKNVRSTFVTRVTKWYLKPEDGPILEGGCGRAHHVAALANWGYAVIGVDNAGGTVAALRELVPELDIRLGDVLRLEFPDDYFAGYWSIGVIEHFWEGFQAIAREMARVVMPGGYLFLTVPTMSPLRKVKAALGMYPSWSGAPQSPPDFYQFVLDPKQVQRSMVDHGFTLTRSLPLDGIKGLRDEIPLFRPALIWLTRKQRESKLVRWGNFVMTNSLSWLTGHVTLMVFELVL